MSSEAITSVPELATQVLPRAERAAELHDERSIVIVTSLGHCLCHVGELVFAGALSAGIMTEFQLKPFEATALGLLGYILMGLGAVPSGLWADTWGPTRVFRVYFFAMALAAVAVMVSREIWQLFLSLTLLGLAASIYHPVGLAMISLGVKAKGRAMGINGVCGSIGVAIGPFLGASLAELGMWRLAYVAVAALALAGALLLEFALRTQKPKEEGEANPFAWQQDPAHDPPASRRNYLPLLLLMGAMMLGGFNYRMLVTALPAFLSTKGAGFIFLTLVVGGVGQFVGGWRADSSARQVYIILLCGLSLATFTLAGLEGDPAAIVVACLVAFFLFGQQPVENTLLAEITTRGRRSLSYGIKFALTFGVGALGGQIVGEIWYWYGTPAPTFYVMSGSALTMAALAVAFSRCSQPPAQQRVPATDAFQPASD